MKPEQFKLDIEVGDQDKFQRDLERAAAIAFSTKGNKSEAIAFLERDIERHEQQYQRDLANAKAKRKNAPKGLEDMIKDPLPPNRQRKVLNAAIQLLERHPGYQGDAA